jgi:hypothetical protein
MSEQALKGQPAAPGRPCAPLDLSIFDSDGYLLEDLQVPAFPVFNAVEALGRGVRRVHMNAELFRAFERFLEDQRFSAVRVADWIAKEKLHTISTIYARPIHQTAKAVKLEVVWSVEMMKVKDITLVNRREYKLYELDCERDLGPIGSREERTLRGVVITREVWVPKSALVEVKP